MHQTGDYVASGKEFSASNWLPTTNMYIDKIQKDLSSDNWTAIFQALRRVQESGAQNERIQAGAPPAATQREALLPADPPTPPPQD